jgi:hypothetical protein
MFSLSAANLLMTMADSDRKRRPFVLRNPTQEGSIDSVASLTLFADGFPTRELYIDDVFGHKYPFGET